MQQHTVTTEASDVPINGLRGDFEVPGNLATGHATDCLHEDELVEVRTLLPVCGVESLAAERAIAGLTEIPLDTLWGNVSPVGSDFFVVPTGI